MSAGIFLPSFFPAWFISFGTRMQTQHYLGIEIGGTKLQLVAGDDAAAIVERQRFAVNQLGGAEGIRQQIAARLPDFIARWKPRALGVGFGGPVDARSGRVARSHQIEGWSGFDLRGWLRPLAGVPVWVENDANTAALGEATRGSGIGFNPVFYVTLGSGVGGGCVVDGRIYHGASPGESELGHVRLDRSGVLVEQRCSGWAVDARIRRLTSEGARSVLCEWMQEPPGGEAALLSRALAAGDREAGRILDETAEDLAFALSHVTHLFHPQIIVLGGGLSLVGEPLRAGVARALRGFVMDVFEGGPQVKLAELGEDAVPVGCLLGAGSADPDRPGR
jgi:glucokinase